MLVCHIISSDDAQSVLVLASDCLDLVVPTTLVLTASVSAGSPADNILFAGDRIC